MTASTSRVFGAMHPLGFAKGESATIIPRGFRMSQLIAVAVWPSNQHRDRKTPRMTHHSPTVTQPGERGAQP